MKKLLKKITVILALAFVLTAVSAPACCAFAAEEAQAEEAGEETAMDPTSAKAIAAAAAIGVAAAAGAIGMSIVISRSNDGIARQPEANGPIRTTMMLGLVFIETAIIYALIVAILIIFVL